MGFKKALMDKKKAVDKYMARRARAADRKRAAEYRKLSADADKARKELALLRKQEELRETRAKRMDADRAAIKKLKKEKFKRSAAGRMLKEGKRVGREVQSVAGQFGDAFGSIGGGSSGGGDILGGIGGGSSGGSNTFDMGLGGSSKRKGKKGRKKSDPFDMGF
jgi:ATPase subunit of ABC transporter with duplicated ATPase domains